MTVSSAGVSVETAELDVPGLPAPVEMRRHPAARRLTLRVSPTRRAIILTVPRSCGPGEAGRFVARNLDWLHQRLAALPPAIPFADGAVLPLRGASHRLRFTGELGALTPVAIEPTDAADELPTVTVAGQTTHAPRRLKEWLQCAARADLERAVARHARNLQLKPRRISVRDQTTRWGSCSSAGSLSFSWRLVMAPTFVLDYVAAHEVAHLQEMNHGPRFWDLVAMTMPRYPEAQAWLRCNGATLHSVGGTQVAPCMADAD